MSVPQRRTVDDIAGPYGNFLTPIPSRGPGVCLVCRRGVVGPYVRCFKCGKEPLGVGHGGADVVAMIALAPRQNQLAYELVNYKRAATSSSMRDRFTIGLAAVLWRWLARHEGCVADAAGVPAFPVLTTVPTSSSGRIGEHPLVRLATGVVLGSSERYRPLLTTSDAAVGQREFSTNRFRSTTTTLAGEAVLLIDDTWTSGAHAHGAAAALKTAGAGAVAVVAIGRWYHPDDPANDPIEQQLRGVRWSWDDCMFER